ncbi:hypothetical protein [Prauserella cavernicola]|uniref:Uncharacterized protein n=1 Tax=Prauserella cavernicola TaxID=2800127 RepID=A0A934QYV6_9PSEU|nr:hypothetical protein [Prauserella cavernicola]MBK1788795.1 hypothetical protein [Prauserella cavernicola]
MAASTNLTPEQRSLRARIAGHTSWATTTDRGAKGRASAEARLRRFEQQIDPGGQLPADERRQRAESAMRAHMLRLAAKSAATRAARSKAG